MLRRAALRRDPGKRRRACNGDRLCLPLFLRLCLRQFLLGEEDAAADPLAWLLSEPA
jgi:hypothetical protein